MNLEGNEVFWKNLFNDGYRIDNHLLNIYILTLNLYKNYSSISSSIKCSSLISLLKVVLFVVGSGLLFFFWTFFPNSYSGMTSLVLLKLGPQGSFEYNFLFFFIIVFAVFTFSANAAAALLLSFISFTSANEYLVHLCGCNLKSGGLSFSIMRHGGISGLTNRLSLPRNCLVSERPVLRSTRPLSISCASAVETTTIFNFSNVEKTILVSQKKLEKIRNDNESISHRYLKISPVIEKGIFFTQFNFQNISNIGKNPSKLCIELCQEKIPSFSMRKLGPFLQCSFLISSSKPFMSIVKNYITFDMSYVNHPDICLSGPPLTLISPDNNRSSITQDSKLLCWNHMKKMQQRRY
ncbi:hypothetical protein AGLY_007802 [Aphis glycines]|uniref:Uncharacterized protein n=1 Tax=Aphis glycines TaxID=307491 RepID=A0A6G0TNH7_APHGL|nr:hypothetical protein AGLY_007802 [Aphis glycines]